nr:MAG: hypothetical protein [Bacteriophage sp.]
MSVSALNKSGARSAAFGTSAFQTATHTRGRKQPLPVNRFTRKDKIKPVQRVLLRQMINYTNDKRKAVSGAKNGQIGLISGLNATALAA